MIRTVFSVILAGAALAGCQPAELGVDDAWVRLPAVQGRPAAAYFTVKGGPQATSLVAVSSPAAIRAEIHEMKHEGGMMTMAPLKDVPVGAGARVEFKPGGKHVMLYDVAPQVRAGTRIPLRLAFADGKTGDAPAGGGAAGDGH